MSTWYTHSFQIHIYTYLPQSAFQIIQYGSRTFLKLEYNFHYFLLSKRFYFILLEAAFVLYTIYTHIITYTYISKKSFLYIFYIHVIYTIWYTPIHVIANISLCIKNYAKFFIYVYYKKPPLRLFFACLEQNVVAFFQMSNFPFSYIHICMYVCIINLMSSNTFSPGIHPKPPLKCPQKYAAYIIFSKSIRTRSS